MPRSRRRYRERGLRSSPFVVLADMTVGLAFFFAIFSSVAALANSAAVKVAQRGKRQLAVREEMLDAIVRSIPGMTPQTAMSGKDKYTSLRLNGREVGQVWENANLQRYMFFDTQFRNPGDLYLTRRGEDVLKGMVPVLKKHSGEFAYMFLHGITERKEETTPQQALSVSRNRADQVLAVLDEAGLISPAGAPRASDQISRKFVVAYGTGSVLYTNPTQRVGRVDLVLFFEDKEEGSVSSR